MSDRPYDLTDLADMERKRRVEEPEFEEIQSSGETVLVDGWNVPSWPRPIPVSERLPEVLEKVLFFAECWRSGVHESGGVFTTFESEWRIDDATHWLPLPPDPE